MKRERRRHSGVITAAGATALMFLLLLSQGAWGELYHSFTGPHTGPHGIALSNMKITGPSTGPTPYLNHPMGESINFTFVLTNFTTSQLTLDQVYVAARYTGRAEEAKEVEKRDFGEVKNIVLKPGGTYAFKGSATLDKIGNWRFWPSYSWKGKVGPLRWHEKIIRVEQGAQAASSGSGIATFAGPDFAPDGMVGVRNFIVAWTPNPKVGQNVKVTFELINASGNPLNFKPDGVFAAARANNITNNKNFGHKSVTVAPGGVYKFYGERKLDEAGRWFLWPGYVIDGARYGPIKWHEVIIDIKQ